MNDGRQDYGSSREWYVALKSWDVHTSEESEASMGCERDLFIEGLFYLRRTIDLALASTISADDHKTKSQVAISERSFFLLWSSWNEVLTARYTSAIDHLRSLFESNDFLYAITVEPTAAQRWLSGKLKVEGARKSIRSFMEDNGRQDIAKDWQLSRAKSQKELEAFSHVTLESCLSFMAFSEDIDSEVLMYKARGEPSVKLMRSLGVYLAGHTVELARASVVALFRRLDEPRRRYNEAMEFAQRAIPLLNAAYAELGMGDGTTPFFNDPRMKTTSGPEPATARKS